MPQLMQQLSQLHFHVIPRYTGDAEDPRRAIRHVIPAKARYWEQDLNPPAPSRTDSTLPLAQVDRPKASSR
jgi:diadenosine tetraphosphate (Ap4A) HIT family hydrolase